MNIFILFFLSCAFTYIFLVSCKQIIMQLKKMFTKRIKLLRENKINLYFLHEVKILVFTKAFIFYLDIVLMII